MKTKHLFYSLALASAFTACTQEELVEAPVVKDNVANRPVAGVVEFSTEGVESRFNYEKENGFELGDVFGLYLMDEFVDGYAEFEATDHKAEHDNANTTPWRYQNHWFDMYNFTNSIQSNYPFTYKSEGGEKVWKNDAKLVEGNYFAMYPHNEVALNRRELWHAIEPSVKLKKHSTKDGVYQNVENQFWLGYEQIYRDATASAEGVMKMDLTMTGAMVALRFNITNNSHNTVKLDKITFRNKDGKTLPTLAFIRPDRGVDEMKWNTTNPKISSAAYGWVQMDVANGEYEKCYDKAHYLYNETETWTRQTIQEIVDWSDLSDGKIPYGLTGAAAEKAYEYSFSYPEGAELLGGVDGGSILKTYVVVPAMETRDQWNDLEVCIYGWYKDNNSASGYTYGVLTSKPDGQQGTGLNEDRNYSFDLVKYVNAWNEQANQTMYYRDVNVNFAEYAWKPFDGVQVANTKDMERMVESYLAQLDDAEPAVLTITPDATGIEITSKFVDMLEADAKDNGRTITLKFSGAKNGKITFNDDNTMDVSKSMTETGDPVTFEYSGNLTLINNAKNQVVTKLTVPVVVENYGSLNVYGYGNFSGTVKNYKDMIVGNNGSHGGTVATIDNLGSLTLKDGADVTTLNNNVDGVVGKVIVDASNLATVGTFNNNSDDECGTCYPSELTVNTGTLKVTNLVNDSKLTNNSTIQVVTRLTNKQHGGDWNPHGDKVYALINNGTINGAGEVVNEGIINNYGKLASSIVKNEETINAYAGEISNLNQQEGNVNVYGETVEVYVSDNTGLGTVTYKDVVAQHVDNHDLITKVYELAADTDMLTLMNKLFETSASQISTSKNITFNKLLKADGKIDQELVNYLKKNITRITITGSNVIFKNAADCDWTWNFESANLVVNNGCKLSIEGRTKMSMKTVSGNVHVANGCELNGARVDHTDVSKYDNVITITASTDANANGSALKNSLLGAEKDDIINLSEGDYILSNNGQSFVTPVVIVGDGDTKMSDPYRNRMQFDLNEDGTVVLKNLKIAKEDGTLGTLWIKSNNTDYQKFILEDVECASIEYDNGASNSATIDVELKSCKVGEIGMIAWNNPATFSNLTYDVSTSIEKIIVRGNSINNNLENIKINGVKPTAFGEQ